MFKLSAMMALALGLCSAAFAEECYPDVKTNQQLQRMSALELQAEYCRATIELNGITETLRDPDTRSDITRSMKLGQRKTRCNMYSQYIGLTYSRAQHGSLTPDMCSEADEAGDPEPFQAVDNYAVPELLKVWNYDLNAMVNRIYADCLTDHSAAYCQCAANDFAEGWNSSARGERSAIRRIDFPPANKGFSEYRVKKHFHSANTCAAHKKK